MRVLGILGSPRMGGNTDCLLGAALEGARSVGAEITRIEAARLSIQPCGEYYNCAVDGTCSIHDDMDAVYESLLAADRIMLASPIFFYGLTAQAKALIDRCQALWARQHILGRELGRQGRKGAFISVGATQGNRLFDGAVLTVRYFFKAVNVEYSDELLVRGIDRKGDIFGHPSVLEEARKLGMRLAQE